MDSETLFYICGGVLAVSAVVLTFAGLKAKNFPGKATPVIVLWFAVFVVGASTFAVRYSQEHEAHGAEHAAEKKTEEGEAGGPYENEGGALGGETEELEEEAEKESEGSAGEEPVGPTEGSQESGESAGDEGKESPSQSGDQASDAGASATTLKLAADTTDIAFDKKELSAKAGEVTIDFDNPSAIPHNVVIEKDGKEIAGTPEITESKESVSAELESGSYTFVCTVPGHEQLGMVGTLEVQ